MARKEAARLLVVGGDGTIHEVAGGLLASGRFGPEDAEPPPIAILPVGTGNDFFRMVRSGSTVQDATRALCDGVPRRFDVGEVRWPGGTRLFVNLVGVGIDVEVLRRRSSFARLPGLAQYLCALGAALVGYEPIPMRVTVRPESGEPVVLEGEVLLAAVTVGPSVGGGFMLSPRATPADGLLDLFHATRLGVMKVLRYLPGILRGAGIARPEITEIQGTHFRFETLDGRMLSFELDGELMETDTPAVEIHVRASALPVLELPG